MSYLHAILLSAGYTGCQPRPEQLKGTPDHTQGTVMACDPEAEKTHCRLIPSYAGLANATGIMQQSSHGIPKLNLASVGAQRSHAGKDPCLVAGQCSSRADYGVRSGPIGGQTSPVRSQSGLMGTAPNLIGFSSSPAQPRSADGAAPPQAFTARPATSGGPYGGCYGSVQGGFQPMSARAVTRPCTTGHYHSGASTWRGTYVYPVAVGTSR